MKFKRLVKKTAAYIVDPDYRFYANALLGFHNGMSDEEYLKRMYKAKIGKELNLENPRTFNEKLQWLKLHNRNPLYSTMVDKYEAKKYIADLIGEEYVVPALGIWDHFNEINFDKLPNQFVLKTTHDSGSVVVCKDKKSFNKEAAKKKLEKSLKKNFYYFGREWPYKDVKPRILAEVYLHDDLTNELRDYKFFAFDGVAKALYITTGREIDRRTDFFDMDFHHLDIQDDLNATVPPQKPETFEKMREIAEKISKGIPEIRVDFYEVNSRAYVGELTLFYLSGLVPFKPEEWDETFGSWIKLPEEAGGGYLLIDDGFVLHISIIRDIQENIRDYKFHCFNGRVKLLYVTSDRGSSGGMKADYFDRDFNKVDLRWEFDNSPYDIKKPEQYEKMIQIAELISKDIPVLRVDFYLVNNQVYVGELTFFDGSGFSALDDKWDKILGDCIDLSLEEPND